MQNAQINTNDNTLCDDNKIIEYFQTGDINEIKVLFTQLDSRNIEHLCGTCLRERVIAHNNSINFADMKDHVSTFSSFKEKDIVISLLCILLEFPATVAPSIQTVIHLLKTGELSGKCALRCIGQIHAVLYKNRFDEESSSQFFRDLLTQVSDGILSLVRDFNEDEDCVNGVISALELLPTIIGAAQYIEQRDAEEEDEDGNTTSISDSIFNSMLTIGVWHSKLFIVLLTIFVDIEVRENYDHKLVEKVHEGISRIDPSDYVGLVKILLQLSDKYQSADYMYIMRSLFPRMKPDARLNTCFVIAIELKNSHSLVKLLLSSTKSFYSSKTSVVSLGFTQHLCDLVLLFLAFENEIFKDDVLQMISLMLTNLSKYEDELTVSSEENNRQVSASASSSSSSAATSQNQPISYVQKLCFSACKIENISEVILVAGSDWCYKQKPFLRSLGESVLVHLFGECPTTQESILSTAFNVISEEPKPIQKQIYLRVLTRIVDQYPATLMQEYLHKIKDWISYLPTFTDLDISQHLLRCFIRLSSRSSSHEFQSFIYMMLKKLLPKRNTDNRRLAIFGFTTLLSEGTSRDMQRDIVSSLKTAFSYNEETLRFSLYKYVTDMIERTTLEPESIQALFKLLSMRTKRYLRLEKAKSGKEYWMLDIVSCFEDNGTEKNPNIYEREPFTELLKCFFTLKLRVVDEEACNNIDSIFTGLFLQLSDVKSLCTLLALSDKRASDVEVPKKIMEKRSAQSVSTLSRRCKAVLITPLMRLAIVMPLYEIMIQLLHKGLFHCKDRLTKCLRLLEVYSVVCKIQSTYQRAKSKPQNESPLFEKDLCISLGKEICEELEVYVPQIRLQDEAESPVRVHSHVSLSSLDEVLTKINWFIDVPQNQDIFQNHFMKVVVEVEKNPNLLDILNDQTDHELNDKERLCIKLLIVARYVMAVYQALHPWKTGSIPDDSELCSATLIHSMRGFIEEQRYHKIVKKMSSASLVGSIRTKCILMVYSLFNRCRFVDEESVTALSQSLLFMFGSDLESEIASSRSSQSRRNGKIRSLYSFKDLIVYFCMHLDKEMKIGCSREHFKACLRVMTALASVYPPNKELSSSVSAMPLVNHITTKRSQTIHKACRILESILKQYIITHSTLIKSTLTFMLTFSQTERSLERCNQIITTCIEKYHSQESSARNMNICEKEKCAVEAIFCVLSYFESLLVVSNNSSSDTNDDSLKLPSIEPSDPSPTDRNMENMKQIVDSIQKIIEMVFEDDLTKKVFLNTKTYSNLEKKIENLLSKLCKYTINNCKLLRHELTRAVRRVVDNKSEDQSIDQILALGKIIGCRSENYYSICKLLSRIQYHRGSILTSDKRETFSDKYASLVTYCEKLTAEIRSLYDKFKSVQKAFRSIPDIPLLHKLSTTEIELLDQDGDDDDKDEYDESELDEDDFSDEDEDDSEEIEDENYQKVNRASRPTTRSESRLANNESAIENKNIEETMRRQKQIVQKRKRELEERMKHGEHTLKKFRPSSGHHPRSRNAFIDFCLVADKGYTSDPYADLEDFIDTSSWEPSTDVRKRKS